MADEWKESIIVPNYRKCDKTIIIEPYHFCQLHTKFYLTASFKFHSLCTGIVGGHECKFQRNKLTTDTIFCICQILKKKWK
jgi:hypothetical protein